MIMHPKVRWIGVVVFLFVCCGVAQTTSGWDMIPPEESVKRAADEFKPAWRVEAERKFREPGLVAFNHVLSAILLTILVVILGVLFHLMVKNNHMEQTAKRVRSGMLEFYTRMWLISRWGFRH